MQKKNQNEIYSPEYVKSLFNSMSKTYDITNTISSFGFARRWRRQCVQLLLVREGLDQGCDLMSGMGELWPFLGKVLPSLKKLVAIDLSDAMTSRARIAGARQPFDVEMREIDILAEKLPGGEADFIVCSYGLKTFNKEQLAKLGQVVQHLLKPGGVFSFVEISKPSAFILRLLYMFYLQRLIPIIGWLFKGNSNDYRMLGIYCEKFGNCRDFQSTLEGQGLKTTYHRLFFGCASAVTGFKPEK